jgi:O-antigen ligase
VFGFGAGDFLGAYREVVVAHPELYQGYMGFGAHNSYFELAAEIGIVGGVSFFLVTVQYATRGLFVATRKGVDFATKYTALGLSVGLTGFIANTFTSNTFQHPQSGLFFWILAGIVAGLGAGLWDAEIRPGTTGEIAADGAVAGSAAAGVLTRTRAWFSRVWRASSAFQVSGASPETGRESWLQSSVVLRWMFGEGERTHRDGE